VQKVAEHLQQRPELLPTLLTTLFEIVLFEECSNQWSLSRPMLSLILINEQVGLCAESLARNSQAQLTHRCRYMGPCAGFLLQSLQALLTHVCSRFDAKYKAALMPSFGTGAERAVCPFPGA
jgi:hypothetical protein